MPDKSTYEELERKIETLNRKLHKSESNVREIQVLAKIGSWEWDLEQQSLLWSDEIYHILGLEPVSFKPSPEAFEATIHPDDLENFLKQRDRVLNEKGKVCIDHRIILPDGSIRYVQERIQQIMNRQGEVCRIIGTVQGITDRMQTLEVLRASEDRYRSLIYSMDDLVFILDNNLVFKEYQLPKVSQLYVKPLDFLGKRIDEIGFPEQVYSLMKKALDSVFKNKKSTSVEYYLDMPTGRFWFDCKITGFLNSHGEHKEVICVVRDITERKRAEEAREKLQTQLIQFEKAESLGRMAGAIAHTFNNHLAVVIGNLELALLGMPQDAALIENVTSAIQGAHKAAEVSGLMLTYLGQTTGKYISMDLSETCRQSVSFLQASTPKATTFYVDLLTPGPVVRGNANHIRQVLVNLITNAWEAMNKQQGQIDVIVKTLPRADIPPMLCFPPDWKPENETYACLEIRDTGCGIEEKDIDKIFDPFFSNKFTGRGLGLAVVLGIIKTHRGTVAVDSEKGEGSSFKVYLPVVAESVAQKSDDMIRDSDMKTGDTILLIEDEEMIRDMTTSILTHLGFKVLQAIDGVDGVKIFQKHQDEIDVVVSDLTMPRMDGWETLAALRRIRPDLPVILTSGDDESMVFAEDHLESPQAFLHKPYKISALKESLEKAMSGSNVE